MGFDDDLYQGQIFFQVTKTFHRLRKSWENHFLEGKVILNRIFAL